MSDVVHISVSWTHAKKALLCSAIGNPPAVLFGAAERVTCEECKLMATFAEVNGITLYAEAKHGRKFRRMLRRRLAEAAAS